MLLTNHGAQHIFAIAKLNLGWAEIKVLSPLQLYAVHAVRTQCEVLDVGKYSNPSFGPLSQVSGSIQGFC